MKKTISFKKNIEFPTMIGEISAISLDHTLKFVDESNIAGEFKITGSYKLTEASRLEEKFDYTIPAEIVLPERIDLTTAKISIDDFYYEIENDDVMICYIDVKVEGVEIIETKEEKEEVIAEEKPTIEPKSTEEDIKIEENRCLEPENNLERECDGDLDKGESEMEKAEIKPPIIEKEPEDEKTEVQENVGSLFSSLNNSEETFATYSIYILRQEETAQSLIEKYHVTKEELENYNDLTNLTIGTKIIVPNTNNE